MEMIINFFKRYELILISITFFMFGILKYFDISLIFGNLYLDFFFLLSIFHIFYIVLPKINKLMKFLILKLDELISFYKSLERIEQLPEKQQEILNKLYLKKEDKFYTKEIKNLIDKKFIILVQNIEGSLNLYKLNPKLRKKMTKNKFKGKRLFFNKLTEKEEKFLNLFFLLEDIYYNEKIQYIDINRLKEKEIIFIENSSTHSMVTLSEECIMILENLKRNKIKQKELYFTNLMVMPSSGSGAIGSNITKF